VTDKNVHSMLDAEPAVDFLNQLKGWVGVILALIKWRVIGLVYTFALTAAAAASLFPSLLIMLAFGLGTVPMLLMVAWGGG